MGPVLGLAWWPCRVTGSKADIALWLSGQLVTVLLALCLSVAGRVTDDTSSASVSCPWLPVLWCAAMGRLCDACWASDADGATEGETAPSCSTPPV